MSQFILGEKAVTVHFVSNITAFECYSNNLSTLGRVCAEVKYELERTIF